MFNTDLLNPSEEADAAADLFSTLDQLATIYGETVATGRYTTVLKARLECRLQPVNRMSPQAAGSRAELMAARDFYWNPAYVLPEQCQIEVDSIRWAPEAGTFQTLRAGNSGTLSRRCSVIRVQVTSF